MLQSGCSSVVGGVNSKLKCSFFLGVFIVAAKRTPFGTYGGVLKDHSATDLAEHAAKAALAAGGVVPELVNSIIMGNVMQVLITHTTLKGFIINDLTIVSYILFLIHFPTFRAQLMHPTLLVMWV